MSGERLLIDPEAPRPGSSYRRAAGPAGVAAAYYIGAQIGFALQSPNAPQSVLWLPNSILLAVLLLVPHRRWPWYLLAAFPAHMLVAWQAGAPLVTLALIFLSNCADAALGAFTVRRLTSGDQQFRFDDLRSMLVFAAFGATLPTLLLSFVDAGISVGTGWAATFHDPFITRVRSNVLTHLVVVPAIVDGAHVDWRQLRPARAGEALLLAGLLFAVCSVAFARRAGSAAFPALLYTPLPLLIWASVRFGPGGAGAGALVAAFVAAWLTLHGRGPFTSLSPSDDVFALQLFLLASATPLLFLAAVVRERDRATLGLQRQEAALRRSYARLRELAGQLISAQESERARIARDMHDDFNQQLAAVSIGISGLRQRLPRDGELSGVLQQLQDRTVALTDELRQFSHELHPRMLDHVGLAAALRTHCGQLEKQHKLRVHLAADEDLGALSRDVAICVYRVVQEGLRNVLNHARVQDAHVDVRRASGGIEVRIADGGVGFDPRDAATRQGLGLLSIEERARLVGGRATVESKAGHGTTLHVYIPVSAP
jgi:two-component system sensor histidine kinase UhpB